MNEPTILDDSDERLGALNELDRPTRVDIVEILSRLERFTREDILRLMGAYAAVDPAARDEAHEGAKEAARRSRRQAATHHLQAYALDRMSSWSGDVMSALYWPGGVPGQGSLKPSEITGSIGPPVLDAIAAVILSGWLDEADYDTLFGPWEEAIDAFDEEGGTSG